MKADRPHQKTMPLRKIVALTVGFLALCTLGGTLSAALLLPSAVMVGNTLQAADSLFDDYLPLLKISKPSENSVMLAADGTKLADFYADNRIIVPSSDIAPIMKKAMVAIEDQRFFEHHGVDAEGLLRALVSNTTGTARSGGSTITQQYVKNVLLDAGAAAGDEQAVEKASERSLTRKFREARYALAIERKYPKDDILTGYLNIASFGPNLYGIEVAAQRYFSIHAKDLNLLQAATLAGITQSPSRWDPIRHPEDAQVRRNTVLAKMLELGYITDAEYKQNVAISVTESLKPSPVKQGCAEAGISAYFCDYVIKSLINDPALLGNEKEERISRLYRGGLVIRTTLDPGKQQAAYDALVGNIPVQDPSQIKIALSSVDSTNGNILAMAQNSNYGVPSETDPTATQINFNADKAHGGGIGFQTGSTYKPFILTEWLKTGHSLYEQVNSTPRPLLLSKFYAPCVGSFENREHLFNNIEGIGGGYMSVLRSLTRSVNFSFIEMSRQMNLCNLFQTAQDMGFKRADGKPIVVAPGTLLGGNESYTLSMAQAFSSFANKGVSCDPVAITSIEDRAGNIIYRSKPTCRQALSEETARQVTYALQTVVNDPNGTGTNARVPGHDVAGKTGTSNRDVAAWFVGYTPQITTAVWQGHPDGNISMFDVTVNGHFYEESYGGLFPALSFSTYMQYALANQPNIPFERPQSLYIPRAPVVSTDKNDVNKNGNKQNNGNNPAGDPNNNGNKNGTNKPTNGNSGGANSGGTENHR